MQAALHATCTSIKMKHVYHKQRHVKENKNSKNTTALRWLIQITFHKSEALKNDINMCCTKQNIEGNESCQVCCYCINKIMTRSATA